MKYTTLLLGLFLLPFTVSANQLTSDQANSLVAVVQSSPTTPAGAFVPLITEFSKITTDQASSLISVIQQAHGVLATAFVNMLIAFTVDVIQPVQTTQTLPIQIVTPQDNSYQQQTLGNVEEKIDNVVMDKKLILGSVVVEQDFRPFGAFVNIQAVYTENGKPIDNVPITVSVPSGQLLSDLEGDFSTESTRNTNGIHGAWFGYTFDSRDKVTATVSANGLVEKIEIGLGLRGRLTK